MVRIPKCLLEPANKIHPDIPEVRKAAQHVETEQEKKIRDARELRELREEGKRLKFFAKHPEFKEPEYTRSTWTEGKESPTLPVNQTEGVRLGKRDAKTRESEFLVPDRRGHGRISKQSTIGKTRIQTGYHASMREIEKAMHPGKKTDTRPGKASKRAVEEITSKHERARKKGTEIEMENIGI